MCSHPREGVFKRKMPTIAPLNFFKEVATELRKVTWPTRAETIRYTAVVFAISVLVGAFIGGLDILFVRITSFLFKR